MIGNKYLQELFYYPDEDLSLNQLLELLKYKDIKFIDSLKETVNIDSCSDEEIEYLTKVSALIDYYLQIHGIDVSKKKIKLIVECKGVRNYVFGE
ncbi:MAG: hypothetical protein WCS98_05670 [Bacillota bacterium]|jgi:hypothetical protein|nr:hypothetical protein [Bacillota bacterium]MDD3299048.1 hypothetical protein [Bacillota bacterium]MDD3851788.1 hypothetical protein [Bacillota bacterium]MDD4708024.1 hypothetical protein [Bacillota bacterium]